MLNIIAILQGVDLSRVSPDALPAGMSVHEAQQRMLCAIVRAFTPASPVMGSDDRPTHVVPFPSQPRADAVQAVREAAVAVKEPPVEFAEPAASAKDAPATELDAADEERALLEEIETIDSLDAAKQVEAEIKGRLDKLQRTDPLSGARVWSAFRKVHQAFQAKAGAAGKIDDVGEARVKLKLKNILAFYKRPEEQWKRITEGMTADEVRDRQLANPDTHLVMESAKKFYPELHKQIVDALDRGREAS